MKPELRQWQWGQTGVQRGSFLKEESTEAGELLDTEEKGWGDSEGDGKHGGGTITA